MQNTTPDGYDIRFVVNTFAPYLLTQMLSPLLDKEARVVNLSSAAQSPVNLLAMEGKQELSDGDAYAQSKLAITMWSRYLGIMNKEMGPIFIAVNPGSFLASKMVKDAFGVAGNDINIGVSILVRAALDPDFQMLQGNTMITIMRLLHRNILMHLIIKSAREYLKVLNSLSIN